MPKLTLLAAGLALILIHTGCSAAPSSPTSIPPQPDQNSLLVDGNAGTGGIPVICGNATGSVEIDPGSFTGQRTISIQCAPASQIQDLETLVQQQTGSTSEVYGAISLGPSGSTFDKNLTVVIPLVQQAPVGVKALTVYYLVPPNTLQHVDDAAVSADRWSVTTSNINHFSTYLVTGPAAVTPTETPLPSPTPPASNCQTSDPGQFVQCYFTAVWQSRNYDYLWTLLTSAYQKSENPDGFPQYTQWGSSIDRVDISAVMTLEQDANTAIVDVNLTFHMHDLNSIPSQSYLYHLIWNSDQQTWQFDLAGKVPVTFYSNGDLASPLVTEALADAIDWKKAFSPQIAAREVIELSINGKLYNPLQDFAYDPLKALSLLGDSPFATGGLPLELLYPSEEPAFAASAKLITANLSQLKIFPKAAAVPAPQMVNTRAIEGIEIITIGP